MTLQTDIETAVAKVTADGNLLHAIVHGPASGSASTVVTEGGPVRSPARLMADLDAQAQTLFGGMQGGIDIAHAHADGTGGEPSTGSARSWAVKLGAAVISGCYSAKEWAVGTILRGVAGGGSARDWATYIGGPVDTAEYSAKKYAADSAGSATAAANSAAAAAAAAGAAAGVSYWGSTTAGTAFALTATGTPTLASYFHGVRVVVIAHTDVAAGATLNLDGKGAKTLYQSGLPIKASAIKSGQLFEAVYASDGNLHVAAGGLSQAQVHALALLY